MAISMTVEGAILIGLAVSAATVLSVGWKTVCKNEGGSQSDPCHLYLP